MAKRALEASSSSERWLPEFFPKHTIFLSHSGHDKPFVERLCEELQRLNHSPFFDQNSNSLPKGERFPPYIFKAAEQCLLAVIVLSEGYLTSKWPMLELVAFVKARETKNPHMKLLPLFYKLSPSDIVPEKWIESWKKLAVDGKIHAREIDLWSRGVEVLMKAKDVEIKRMKSWTEQVEHDQTLIDDFPKFLAKVVQDLRPFNGLEFSKYGTSEGRYIQAVVNEICEIIPPMMKYKIDHIQGYQRMCEKVSLLFEEGTFMNVVCKSGCLYLGLYGMGGVGKTTLCGAMCSFYQMEFCGRVCHVELRGDSMSERLERVKHVIRQLGGFDDRVVQRISEESQGFQCLEDQLKSQAPAFLVVDNVGDSERSRDEARRFISCGLAHRSKIMVTSRSRLILESILGEAKYCKPVPRLQEQEAEELFLSVAIPQKLLSPLQPGEEEIVKACVEECKFLDDGYDTHQYHPLVLRALGTFFHDVDRCDWEEALMSKKKLQASRDSKHVNDILGLNYATLSDGQKLLFLDVVFLFNYAKYSLLYLSDHKGFISLVADLHGISIFDAKFKVKELQRKSFIYESSPTLQIHDLYIEFAWSLVSIEGSKENEWWVGQRNAYGHNLGLKRLLLIEDVSKISHSLKHLRECPSLECLIMHNCHVSLKPELYLECFTNLRLLIIFKYGDVLEEVCAQNEMEIPYGLKDEYNRCLPELRRVQLIGFDLRRLPFLRHCWNLTYLSVDNCDFNTLGLTLDGTSLFENLKALETLLLSSRNFVPFPNYIYDGILQGASEMKNLKCLEIVRGLGKMVGDGFSKLDLSPLGRLTSLKTLSLPNLPAYVTQLIGLDQLSQLIELNLHGSKGLFKLPNLHLLPKLQRICINSCLKLEHLEDQLKCFQKMHSNEEMYSSEEMYPEQYMHQCLEVDPLRNWIFYEI